MSTFVSRVFGEKKRYRRYKTRTNRLPETYRGAIDALSRYLMYFGSGKGDELMDMLEDLADLFEESVANETPVRDIVGEDPVEFAETFRRNYPAGQWIVREQERLTSAIAESVDSQDAR